MKSVTDRPYQQQLASNIGKLRRANRAYRAYERAVQAPPGIKDVFYVVLNPVTQIFKVGVTAGDGEGRLRAHRAYGFNRVTIFATERPDAVKLEAEFKADVALAGYAPAWGDEFFFASDVWGIVLIKAVDLIDDPKELEAIISVLNHRISELNAELEVRDKCPSPPPS